nr:RNA-directed DNA polymerase, eukaryota, reverse transcriptase zinc-binding domain protein [Tanacetum cinerariifolium]
MVKVRCHELNVRQTDLWLVRTTSQVMGIGVPTDVVNHGAASIGCTVMNTPFKYLGVTVGDNMSRHLAWSVVIQKIRSRLSSWKAKTLSIGGRLTLLKAVLGAVPLYFIQENQLGCMEKCAGFKKKGGLGVLSYYALNRALLLKWFWRFLSKDGSLWYQSIQAIHGDSVDSHDLKYSSCWNSIMREVNNLSSKGFDFKSHCKIRVGNGLSTRFWLDYWATDQPLCIRFPRIFALENNKVVSIASRRQVWDGAESQQWTELLALYNSVSLSPLEDRWYCDLNGEGLFCVKDIRLAIDELFLPGLNEVTRWVNFVPIKARLKDCWKEFFLLCGGLYGGLYGPFVTGAFLILRHRSVPRCLMILSRFRFFGVLTDVLVIFLMKTGLKLLI